VLQLKAAGAQIVRGDLLKRHTLAGLFRDVDQAYLITVLERGANDYEDEVAQGTYFIEVAKAEKLRHLVYQSVSYARTTLSHCATKGKVEDILKKSGIPHTILRPAMFMEALEPEFRGISSEEKAWSKSSPIRLDVRLSWVHIDDIARVAMRVLSMNRPKNAAYELAHPRPVSFARISQIASQAYGVEITFQFQPLTVRDMAQEMLSNPARYLRSVKNPQADYYATLNRREIVVDPAKTMRDFDIRFTSLEKYIRSLARLGCGGSKRKPS
jgi:uncharacterized protein YbjT (DUF2867 family)